MAQRGTDPLTTRHVPHLGGSIRARGNKPSPVRRNTHTKNCATVVHQRPPREPIGGRIINGDIPHAGSAIYGGRDNELRIGAKARVHHPVSMTQRSTGRLTSHTAPQSRRLVGGGSHDHESIKTEGGINHRSFVWELSYKLAASQVPQARHSF